MAAAAAAMPEPAPPEEPIELLTPELRRACAAVATYWRADPGAGIRALDSVVTRPADRRTADACWVIVRLEGDHTDGEFLVPFAASGWLPVHEHDADGPGMRSRVWQLDPVRCLVVERWRVMAPSDTVAPVMPWFEQATACFRRQ